MRQTGVFKYRLKDENGYFIDDVKSDVEIKVGDVLGYKGNQLQTIRVYENELRVKKTGEYITVE